MIEVTIGIKPDLPLKPLYPWIGRVGICIVLFTERNTGVSLAVTTYNHVGETSNDWSEDIFVPVIGPITLQNS